MRNGQTTTIEKVPTWTLSDRLTKARESAGLTPEDMGAELRMSARTVRNYEKGATTPQYPTLARWSSVTAVPLWWLLGEEPADNATAEGGGVTLGNQHLAVAA